MKAPFPYFGGKLSVASVVWKALGQPRHYIEPFFGSGAVLLNRPNYDPKNHVETVCDKDGFVSNVWRSLKFSPDKTAEWADWPVNHADLSARKRALIANEGRLLENLIIDDEWHDPKMAGYWIWAASCWIGSGMTRLGQIPHICQVPHLSKAGMGIHAIGQRPHLSGGYSMSKGVHKPTAQGHVYQCFDQLSERLRYVRVVCGDWTRVCGGNWQDNIGDCGIFFDPPYSDKAERKKDLYQQDDLNVAYDVRKWCMERGDRKSYRIVLAGYFDEHKELLDCGWSHYQWKTQGGYSKVSNNKTNGKANRHKECLFFSPHCLNNKDSIFDLIEENEEETELVLA